MAQNTPSPPPLTHFEALSFDVYATLIDWESGILTALEPLIARLPANHPKRDSRHALLELFTRNEGELQRRHPDMAYTQLLGEVYACVAEELDLTLPSNPSSSSSSSSSFEEQEREREKSLFGTSVARWPAFPDTVAALRVLARHYKLIVLSNVDGEAFAGTLAGPLHGVTFDAVYTAQQIGSYKPDVRNFEYMIDRAGRELGIGGGQGGNDARGPGRDDGGDDARGKILHTAQALWHDHVPAKKVGLRSCWIERAGDDAAMGGRLADLGDRVDIAYRFRTLGDMAEAVKVAFGDE